MMDEDIVSPPRPGFVPGEITDRAVEVMKHVLACEGFDEAWPCLSAAGLGDVRSFKNCGPRRLGGMLAAIGTAVNLRALKYARAKCKRTAEGLPCSEDEFLSRLTTVCRLVQLRESEFNTLVAGSPKIGGRSLSGATEKSPATEVEVKLSKSEKDMSQADGLLRCVELQNHNRLPPSEMTPPTGDVLAAHDQLIRKPPRCARPSSLSLRSRTSSTSDEGSRHKVGKTFKHKRGENADDEHEMFKTAATGAKKPYVWKHCVEMMVGEPRGRTPTPPFPKQHLT